MPIHFRPTKRRAAVATMAITALVMVLHPSAGTAGEDPHRVDGLGRRVVTYLAGQESDVTASSVDETSAKAAVSAAATAAAAGTGGEVAAPTTDVHAAATCVDTTGSDPRDAPHIDGAAYSISYDCDDRTYVGVALTYDLWVRDELDWYLLVLDTDNNTANGCNGGDYSVIGYWSDANGLVARALRTPGCDAASYSDRGEVFIDRAGEVDVVGMVFTADQIGSPASVRWLQSLSGLYNSGTDLMPDSGMKSTVVPGGGSPAPPAVPAQTVFGYGTAYHGSTGATRLNAPLVGMAPTEKGNGYWLLGGDGGIFSYGDARFYGSTGGRALNRPVVGLAAHPVTQGYWFVASDGGIFAFNVPFFGSTGSKVLNKPVVGMSATKSGNGYWLVASDGGIFSFGDAAFSGSTGGMSLNQPIVGMTTDPDGRGYWFVAADGGIFAFDAPFHGSAAGRLVAGDRVVSMAASPTGGYWVTSARGAVFAFGGAVAHGQAVTSGHEFSGVAAHPTNGGFWLVAKQ